MSAPTWYDVLGVERDASADEVRSAWRAATDRAEPGTGQFRACNEAAEVLLDPQRRAAYDATLAPVEEPTTPLPPTGDLAGPERDRATGDAHADAAADDDEAAPTRDRDDREDLGDRRPPVLARSFGRASNRVLALLVVLVLALAVASTLLGSRVQAQARVADAREQAPIGAERAAEAVLSYDYRRLPEDKKKAEGYLTGGFQEEFAQNFDALSEQKDGSEGLALQTKAVVAAQAVGSGVIDVSDDGRTARVLVFVNQTSQKEGQDPQVFLNRVAMTMQERDGSWLVSDLRSY